VASWPSSAGVRDATTFDARLLGRSTASDQDTWTRYWISTRCPTARTPWGSSVDQRSLQWNYPTGNQDIVYFVFTLYNVTARSNGVYANPTIPVELQRRSPAWDAPFKTVLSERWG